MKTLAIQFKYFGDVVFITPALQALKQQHPNDELHVLVAAEIAPLLDRLPFIDKVWPMPRVRGTFSFKKAWPLIQALRSEKFQRSVDFGGNDRGALLSRLVGAPTRLSYRGNETRIIQALCYTQRISVNQLPKHWVAMHMQLLATWGINPALHFPMKLASNPLLDQEASKLMPSGAILCHIATSQPKKEWLPDHWVRFHQLARQQGYTLVFTSGTNKREMELLEILRALEPAIQALPASKDIQLFLALLKRAKLVISGDTGPLHFATGLGTQVLGLYGTGDSITRAAPNYSALHNIQAPKCVCDLKDPTLATCQQSTSCMSLIQPEEVLERVKLLMSMQ